jgi:hypothetical protein
MYCLYFNHIINDNVIIITYFIKYVSKFNNLFIIVSFTNSKASYYNEYNLNSDIFLI